MGLIHRTKADKKEEIDKKEVSIEEINKTIAETQYCKSDLLLTMLDKYKALCELKEKCDDKKQRKVIHNAQWVFINSIQTPHNKEEMLNFIINTLPFAKTDSKGLEILSAMASIGIKTIKGASTVGKVATLGLANNAIGKMEGAVQTALVSQDMELTMLWRNKLVSVFEEAKALSGGRLSKDKEFASQLKELKRQFDELNKA